DLTHSAGGSSGGEAAAIATGCSAGGVGSDGGGSIRVPAHFCGICGLKPTPGRIPATGHFPPGAGAFSWIGVVGPMARTIADVRSLVEVMAGPDAGDALSAPVPLRACLEDELLKMRIGILESDTLGVATAETRATVERAAKSLDERGFTVEPFRLDGLDRALDLWWFFFGPVIGNLFRHSVDGYEDKISPMFREYLAYATSEGPITLQRFTKACADRDLLRAEILRQMQDTAVLLSPVSTSPAFRHGQGNYLPGVGYRHTMRFSQWLNLTGFPGVSVTAGVSKEGLPIGVQVVGRPVEDELVLAVAEAIEQGRGPWPAPPSDFARTDLPLTAAAESAQGWAPDHPLATGVPYSAGLPCSSARPRIPSALPFAVPVASGFVLARSAPHGYPLRDAARYQSFSNPVPAYSVSGKVLRAQDMRPRSWHPGSALRGMISPRPRPFAYANRARRAVRNCRRDPVPARYHGEIRLRPGRFHPDAYRRYRD